MRPFFVTAALVCLVACDTTIVTPPGSTLVDAPEITKLSVTPWTVGAPKGAMEKVAKSYRYDPGAVGKPVRFKIAFEHGPVAFLGPTQADKPDAVPGVRAIHIEVVENTQWAMATSCEDKLSVPMATKPDGSVAYPTDVWARCSLTMRRKNGDITVGVPIEIHANGTVSAQAIASDAHVVEE